TEVRPHGPLALLYGELRHDMLAARLELDLLSSDEAAELLARLLDSHAAAEDAALWGGVLERAHGVPYFLVSFAQGPRSGDAHRGHGEARAALDEQAREATRATSAASPPQPQQVPHDVAEGIRQRAAVLSSRARQLLGVAAVIGRQVPYRLLVAVAAGL